MIKKEILYYKERKQFAQIISFFVKKFNKLKIKILISQVGMKVLLIKRIKTRESLQFCFCSMWLFVYALKAITLIFLDENFNSAQGSKQKFLRVFWPTFRTTENFATASVT